jgi:hypothetical protein
MQRRQTGLFLVVLFLICAANVRADTTWVAAGEVTGTWTQAGSPYMIYDGAINVPLNGTLTIQPGVKVYFDGPFLLMVQGRLDAVGTPQDSIYFTAAPSDTIESAWGGVYFDSTSSDLSQVSYARLEHANGWGYMFQAGGAVQIRSANPHFDHCLFWHNRTAHGLRGELRARMGGAVYLYGSNAEFTNCVFTANNPGYIGLGGAIFCDDTTGATFRNCVMTEDTAASGGAIAVHYGNPGFINCDISQNYALFNGGAVHLGGEWSLF